MILNPAPIDQAHFDIKNFLASSRISYENAIPSHSSSSGQFVEGIGSSAQRIDASVIHEKKMPEREVVGCERQDRIQTEIPNLASPIESVIRASSLPSSSSSSLVTGLSPWTIKSNLVTKVLTSKL